MGEGKRSAQYIVGPVSNHLSWNRSWMEVFMGYFIANMFAVFSSHVASGEILVKFGNSSWQIIPEKNKRDYLVFFGHHTYMCVHIFANYLISETLIQLVSFDTHCFIVFIHPLIYPCIHPLIYLFVHAVNYSQIPSIHLLILLSSYLLICMYFAHLILYDEL